MISSFLKKIRIAIGLALAISMPSCLQNETTITLNKDGSGTVIEETLLTGEMLTMMSQFAQPGGPDPVAEMFSEEKAKAKAPKLGEGVKFVKTEKIERDGKKGARTEYKFADINQLRVSASDAINSLNDRVPKEDNQKDETVKFSYADGVLNIHTPPADFDNMENPGGKDAQNPQMEEMMTKLMADMDLKLKLVISDGIAETNASYRDENIITLFDVQVGKMFAQKDRLKDISLKSKTDMAGAKADFSQLEGVKVEPQEDVTVTLK